MLHFSPWSEAGSRHPCSIPRICQDMSGVPECLDHRQLWCCPHAWAHQPGPWTTSVCHWGSSQIWLEETKRLIWKHQPAFDVSLSPFLLIAGLVFDVYLLEFCFSENWLCKGCHQDWRTSDASSSLFCQPSHSDTKSTWVRFIRPNMGHGDTSTWCYWNIWYGGIIISMMHVKMGKMEHMRIPLFQWGNDDQPFFPFLISAPSVGSVGRIWTSVEIPILKEVRTHVLLRLAIPHDLPRAHSDQNEESCSRWAGSASPA